MSGIINFIKNLIGIGADDESFIGLSRFDNGSKELRDTPHTKKEGKKEISLSEMLRRS